MRTLAAKRALCAEDLARSNLPEEFWRVQLQGVQPAVRPTIDSYVSRFPDHARRAAGLILWGSEGVGKTSIGALVLKSARAWGCSAYFTTVFDLREALRNKQMHDDQDEVSVFARCKEVDVLVLDNMRLVDENEMYVNFRLIEELLVGRGSRKKLSVLTTRLSYKELSERRQFLSASETHRVSVQVTGQDLRKQAAAQMKASVLSPNPTTSKG